MPLRHAALAATIAAVWGVNFVVIHVGLESFPPLLFAALRFTAVALPAVFFVARPGVGARWVLAIGLSISAGQFGLLFVAMDQGLPAGVASLVLQLQAAFTVLLAVAVLGERLRAAQAGGIALALGGIGVIALGRADGVPLVAFGLALGAALCWAIGNVCTRHVRPERPISLLVWASLVPPLPLAALSVLLEDPAAATLDGSGLLALAYVVVLSTFFGFGAWTWLLRRHPASVVAPFSLLVPPVGIAAAWIALGERPNLAEAAGAAVVLAGLLVCVRGGRLRTRARRVHGALAAAQSRQAA
jgi:O-acetylserine/cysteine efflux transporter